MATKRSPGAREQVYRFVRERVLAGDPPTVREVQRALGFAAVQSAQQHLDALVAEGRLARGDAGSRKTSLELPEMPPPSRLVPLLGRVQAGAPQLAEEHIEGYVPVTLSSRAGQRSGALFALRVRGESMKLAGILDGDVVIVRAQRTAENGDVVVALIGDEATVKTLRMKPGRIELHPANPDFAPIVLRERGVSEGQPIVLGKVIELRRSLERPPDAKPR